MTLMLKVAEAEGYAAAISTVSIAEGRGCSLADPNP